MNIQKSIETLFHLTTDIYHRGLLRKKIAITIIVSDPRPLKRFSSLIGLKLKIMIYSDLAYVYCEYFHLSALMCQNNNTNHQNDKLMFLSMIFCLGQFDPNKVGMRIFSKKQCEG